MKNKLKAMIKIVVGVGENKDIIKSCDIFKNENENVEITFVDNDNDLVNAILDEEVDATIRGSLPASSVMKQLKSKFSDISRATYINGDDVEFLLTPVGIDEGETLEDKLKIAINCGEFLKRQSKTPKIAVMASGRKGDYGRSDEISKSIDDSEELTDMIKENTPFELRDLMIKGDDIIKNYPKINIENIDTLLNKLLLWAALNPKKNNKKELLLVANKLINSKRGFYIEN